MSLSEQDESVEKACRIIWEHDNLGEDGYYICSNCGVLPKWVQLAWDDYQAGKTELEFYYCPRCGAKVVKR